MGVKLTFFPVDNGDMTLLELDSGKKILIDCKIRKGEDYPDVLNMLRKRLNRDGKGRLYIDLLIWSHPDLDHCQGVEEHFHLGKPEDWSSKADLIFINEIWSSPMVYRRANSTDNVLTDDAKALNKEVKRRVNNYIDVQNMDVGNYVMILGEDEGGKTDDISEIVLPIDEEIVIINGERDTSYKGILLGPSPKSEIEEIEDEFVKNNSSVIFNHTLYVAGDSINYLTGGDAEVVCWEILNDRMSGNGTEDYLNYDVLLAPHHCSWHTLSRESLSKNENPRASKKALDVLNRAEKNAYIISSSKPIKSNDADPPAFKAKEEYLKILDGVQGTFKCVADHKRNGDNIPLELEFSRNELRSKPASSIGRNSSLPNSAVNRKGGDGYA